MSPRAVRRLVIAVFVTGIAGMIAGSIRDNNGFAITFGIVTAIAALCLILVTSVVPPEDLRAGGPTSGDGAAGSGASAGGGARRTTVDPAIATDVEARIRAIVGDGADEQQVRLLVRRAVELGRSAPAGR